MKIVYVFRDPFDRRQYDPGVLTQLGHSVTAFEISPKEKHALLTRQFVGADMVFFTEIVDFNRLLPVGALREIKKGNTRLVFFGALVEPVDALAKWFEPFDWVFIRNEPIAQRLCEYTHSEKYVWMPTGFHPSQYFPSPQKVGKDIDVSFAGDTLSRLGKNQDTRAIYLKSMLRHIGNTRIYGHRLCKRVGAKARKYKTHREERSVYWRTKVNLDLPFLNYPHLANDIHIKNRTIEIPACGEIQLTAYDPSFVKLFKSEEEVFYYTSKNDMVDKAKWIIENYDKLGHVREAARKRSMEEHQYIHRYKKMMDIAE